MKTSNDATKAFNAYSNHVANCLTCKFPDETSCSAGMALFAELVATGYFKPTPQPFTDALRKTIRLTPHRDDQGIDEIRVHIHGAPHLRLVTIPRFKTSGLSGDEWRTSTLWQERLTSDDWKDLDGPYQNPADACAAIFPGVYKSHPAWHKFSADGIEFLRKGHSLGLVNNDGDPMPLLPTLGHLPWAERIFLEDYSGPFWLDHKSVWGPLCMQVGCAEHAVSAYMLRKVFCPHGHGEDVINLGAQRGGRLFCVRHLRRGDCGLEDCDSNYIVLAGPGPDESVMPPADESRSTLVVLSETPIVMPKVKKKKPS